METNILRAFRAMSFVLRAAPAFFFTTYQLFLAMHGMNILQMSLINCAYMISVFILEIPTGAFADSFGRKQSIICGCMVLSLSYLLYFTGNTLAMFIIAEIVGAFGATLISGALDAWAVDALAANASTLPLEQLFRQEENVGKYGIIIGSLLGALAGTTNLAWPWLLSGLCMIAAAVCAHRLIKEPEFATKTFKFTLAPLKQTIHESWHAGRTNPSFIRIAVAGAILGISVQSMNMQWSILFHNGFKLPVWSLGLIFVAISLFTALGARLAPMTAQKTAHDGQSIALAFVFIGLMMIFSGQATWLIPAMTFFLLHEMGRGTFSPLKKAIINRRIEGQNRATMLSLDSMVSHAGAVIGLIGGGWISTSFSLGTAWASSGILLIAIAPFIWKRGI